MQLNIIVNQFECLCFFCQIHLRQFNDTKYSAMEPEMEETNIDGDVPEIASSLMERKH